MNFQVDASKAETESDDIANDYLEKNIESTDEFLEKFVVSIEIFVTRKYPLRGYCLAPPGAAEDNVSR